MPGLQMGMLIVFTSASDGKLWLYTPIRGFRQPPDFARRTTPHPTFLA